MRSWRRADLLGPHSNLGQRDNESPRLLADCPRPIFKSNQSTWVAFSSFVHCWTNSAWSRVIVCHNWRLLRVLWSRRRNCGKNVQVEIPFAATQRRCFLSAMTNHQANQPAHPLIMMLSLMMSLKSRLLLSSLDLPRYVGSKWSQRTKSDPWDEEDFIKARTAF